MGGWLAGRSGKGCAELMTNDSAAGQLKEGEESSVTRSDDRPWDARLALAMVRPFANTALHPNHITTLGLAIGILAAVLYATGRYANLGALFFVLATVLDHADGELARLTRKTSAFGHVYDRVADLCVKLSLFSAMGFGLRHSVIGDWAIFAGLCAGLALIAIFMLRGEIARRRGASAIEQPSLAGFELEDILYIVAPLTWCGLLLPFVVAAGIGAPLFAVWVSRQYLALRSVDAARNSECPS